MMPTPLSTSAPLSERSERFVGQFRRAPASRRRANRINNDRRVSQHRPAAACSLTSVLLAGLMVAICGTLLAQTAMPVKLAKAFPRETMYYGEAWKTPELRALYGEEGLAKAGVSNEDMEEIYGAIAGLLGSVFVDGISAVELREILEGIDRYAGGILDVKMPNMEGGMSSPPSPTDIMRTLVVAEHSNLDILKAVLEREVKGGSPNIESAKQNERYKALIYTLDPRFSKESFPGQLGPMREALEGSFRGVLALADGKYLIWAPKEADVLQALEGLRDELPEDETLPSNPVFRRCMTGVPKEAFSVEYFALREVMRLADKFEPVRQTILTFELDKIQAFTGYAVIAADGKSMHGEGRAIFRGDKGPEWYEILRCPPKANTLELLLGADPANPPTMSMWIGIEDMVGRMEKIGEYGGPKVEKIIKLFQDQFGGGGQPEWEGMPGEEGDMPGGEMPPRGQVPPAALPPEVKQTAEEAKKLFALAKDELAAAFYIPGDLEKMTKAAPPWTVAMWIKDDTTLDTLYDTLMGVVGAPPREEGKKPSALSFNIGEGEKAPVISSYVIDGDPSSDATPIVGVGVLPGHGRFAIISSVAGARIVAASMAAATAPDAEPLKPAQAHFSMRIALGQVVKALLSAMPSQAVEYSSDGSTIDMGLDPITGHMLELVFGMLAKIDIAVQVVAEPTQIKMAWQLHGVPEVSTIAKVVRFAKKLEQKEDVSQKLRRLRSEVIVSHFDSPDGAFPASLKAIASDSPIGEEGVKDPMSNREFGYLAPKAGTKTDLRFLLAWQDADHFGGIGRIAILLNGDIEIWNTKQFAAAEALAKEGKAIPRLDKEGKEVAQRRTWRESRSAERFPGPGGKDAPGKPNR